MAMFPAVDICPFTGELMAGQAVPVASLKIAIRSEYLYYPPIRIIYLRMVSIANVCVSVQKTKQAALVARSGDMFLTYTCDSQDYQPPIQYWYFLHVKYLPDDEHVLPSGWRVNPESHKHMKPPAVLSQPCVHPPLFVSHSFISENTSGFFFINK